MKKRWFLLVLPLLCCLSADARLMRDVFSAMPDSLLPILTKNNRLDCIDFRINKMEAVVENAFGGRSEMTALTDDYCFVRLTDVSDVALKILPRSDSTDIVCLIHTYRMPAAESRIAFYTSAWEPLPAADFLQWPAEEAFWAPGDSCDEAQLNRLKATVDAPMLQARLSPDANHVTISLSLEALSDEDRKRITPLLKNEQVLTWNGERFVPATARK